MRANSPSQSCETPARRKWQFSLRAGLLAMLGLSIVLAIASQFPRLTAFAALMLLWLMPQTLVALLLAPLLRLWMLNPVRLLGFCGRQNAPTLPAGLATAGVSSLVLVGLWPLLREVGCVLSLISRQPIFNYAYTWKDAASSMADALFSRRYWLRLWQWEAWSLGRWWLLFGTIALAWLIVSLPFRRRLQLERPSATGARFFAFAPWLIVLEVAFLIGVWLESPATVPEPSTGFVVGIFSWNLWHWDCWLNRGWLIRGALPTVTTGGVFFAGVLRWRWPVALIAAILLIPVALLLSVACTVAYQNGFPPLVSW